MNRHCRGLWTLLVACSVALAPVAMAQSQDRAAVGLRAAMEKETVDGDLKAAIEQYKKIAAQPGVSRSIAATALLHLGQCYEKLGQADARKTYERLLRDFGDQAEIVKQARERLSAMGPSPASTRGTTALRQLHLKLPGEWGWGLLNISADGRLAGATNYSTSNAAVVDLTSGEGRDVTAYGNWSNSSGEVGETVISRDGAQLAFWHYKPGTEVKMEVSLRVIGTDGHGERVLYRSDSKTTGMEWGIPRDWSADGKYIAMQLERGRQGSLVEGVTDFVLVSVAAASTRVLKTYEYIQRYRPKILFSPNGRYLAYDYPSSKEQVQGDLRVVAVDGSSDSVVAADPAQDRLAAWTPDGSILFTSTRSGKQALWHVPINNGRQAGEPELVRPDFAENSVLGTTKTGAVFYAASRNTTNAYFTSFDQTSGRLSTSISRLTPLFTGMTSTPAWSPDGREVAYCIHRMSDGTITIGIRSLDTGKERELLPAVKILSPGSNLKWSPDGRSLLALGSSDTQTGLYRIDVASGATKFVTQGPSAHYVGAEWTADGKWFFTTDVARRSIVRRNTETGEEKTIYTAPRPLNTFSLSTDGKLLAFVEDFRHLRVIPMEGGAAAELFVAPGRISFHGRALAWTPDNQTILFSFLKTDDSRDFEVWRVSLQGGDAQPTGLRFQRTPGPLQFHPDGRRLAFSRSEAKTEYWVMENFLPVEKASK